MKFPQSGVIVELFLERGIRRHGTRRRTVSVFTVLLVERDSIFFVPLFCVVLPFLQFGVYFRGDVFEWISSRARKHTQRSMPKLLKRKHYSSHRTNQ